MLRSLCVFVLTVIPVLSGCHNLKALPDGTSFQGEPIASANVAFVADKTWVDENGERHVEQAIFNDVFRMIAEAREFILLDNSELASSQ